MAFSKIILNGETQIDLTQDTVNANASLSGSIGHQNNGTTFAGSISTVAQATPSISINTSNGLITASATQSAGVVTTGTATTTSQLSTVAGTTITPTESQQTAVAANKYTTGEVKVGAISNTYVGSSISTRSSANLTANGATVTAPAGYYAAAGTKAISSGTQGTPTATKGTVSNHTISVTPSVTNTAGYISGGTRTGTAVTVAASELVSGSTTLTNNGTYNIANLSTAVVNVSGGGSSDVQVGSATAQQNSNTTIIFNNLLGEPTSFSIVCGTDGVSPSSTSQPVAFVYDGTNCRMQTITNTSNAQVTYVDSGFTFQYSSGELGVSVGSGYLIPDETFMLLYTYGGSANNIVTEDVQVGSGATSITFTGLADEPECWSCIFKSNFSTSSGYQRVIAVMSDGTDTIGLEMDSSAKTSLAHWTSSYSNGSLTITSQGTNAGGYFHQPGYYQLTYVIDTGDGTLQTKTVTPSTVTQNVTADTAQGYTALQKVVVNPIPSSYVLPASSIGSTTYRASTAAQTIAAGSYHTAQATIAAVTQTNLTAENIKSGTTISISNGQSNLWSVTGSYTGSGGGGTMSIASTTWSNTSNTATSHQFTGLSGTPKFAVLRCTTQLTRSSNQTYYYIADIIWNGSNAYGNYHLRSNGSYNNVATNATSKYNVSTGTNSITFSSQGSRSAAPGSFYNGTYELTYVY